LRDMGAAYGRVRWVVKDLVASRWGRKPGVGDGDRGLLANGRGCSMMVGILQFGMGRCADTNRATRLNLNIPETLRGHEQIDYGRWVRRKTENWLGSEDEPRGARGDGTQCYMTFPQHPVPKPDEVLPSTGRGSRLSMFPRSSFGGGSSALNS